LTIALHPAERKSANRLTNSFRNGSVDGNAFSATAFADNGLQQTPNPGCSPGCRNDRLCESAAGTDWQQLDPQLLKLIESWPRLSAPIKAALITMIEAAIST